MVESAKDQDPTAENFADIYTMVAKLIGAGKVPVMSANRLGEAVAEAIGIYPVPNLAVENCTKMFIEKAEEMKAEGRSADIVLKAASAAYMLSIPPITGADSIGDFISCVTKGMLLGAIPGPDATRLLYAAQVAHTAFPKRKNLMKLLQKGTKKKPATRAASTTSDAPPRQNADPSPLTRSESPQSQNPGVNSPPVDGC